MFAITYKSDSLKGVKKYLNLDEYKFDESVYNVWEIRNIDVLTFHADMSEVNYVVK